MSSGQVLSLDGCASQGDEDTCARVILTPCALKRESEEHARNFITNKELQIHFLSSSRKFRNALLKPVITATYDAELFGHWWFEGPEWLDFVMRGIFLEHKNFITITPSEYLGLQDSHSARLQVCQPSMSSWGHRGYNEVWLNSSNDYMYRHLHKSIERMIYLADRFSHPSPPHLFTSSILERALNQAARELLLSQQSDWAFIMKTGTATEYAIKRFEEHIGSFHSLYQSIISNTIEERWLTEIENRNKVFQNVDYRIYCSGG
jgi:1,4-alpha-glucan branching enzyme